MSRDDPFPALPDPTRVGAQDIDWSNFRLPGQVLGPWRTWTATPTNLTVGNGTVNAKYVEVGKTVHLWYHLVFGSTTSMGTSPRFALPLEAGVTLGSGTVPIGPAQMFDTGTATHGGVTTLFTTTTVAPRRLFVSGSNVQQSTVTATLPFTWTTGDELAFSGTYEAA